jgi:hypothetical protein
VTALGDLLHNRTGAPLARLHWRLLWLAAAVAVHLSLLRLHYFPESKPFLGDEGMYLQAAHAVLEQGRSQLGSFWPPLYAWFLAPLVGASGGALWLVQLVQTALLVLCAWLLRELIELALDDHWAADLSALFVLSYPPLVAYAHYLWPEVLHLSLMLGAAWMLLRFGPRPAAVIGGGGLLALALQSKVLLLPFLPMLALGLWRRWPGGRRFTALLLLTATVGLGVLPTLLAQRRDFGRWMLADSGAFNLWVGLNEASRGEFVDSVVAEEYLRYQRSARTSGARSRIAWEKIAQLIEERGWARTLRRQLGRQYQRLFDHESFLTRQLVGGEVWLRGEGYRAGDSKAGYALRWMSFGSWAILLAAAAWGIVFFPYRQRGAGGWVLGFLLLHCALFLALHVKTRYRIQMLPALVFFAVYAGAWWRLRTATADAPRLEPARTAAGMALAGVLLYLAFGG